MTPTEQAPGLQTERTVLAWQRTVLSLTVMLMLAVKLNIGESSAWMYSAACASCVFVLAMVVRLRVIRWSAPSQNEPSFPLMLRDGRAPLLLALVMLIAAVVKAVDVIARW